MVPLDPPITVVKAAATALVPRLTVEAPERETVPTPEILAKAWSETLSCVAMARVSVRPDPRMVSSPAPNFTEEAIS